MVLNPPVLFRPAGIINFSGIPERIPGFRKKIPRMGFLIEGKKGQATFLVFGKVKMNETGSNSHIVGYTCSVEGAAVKVGLLKQETLTSDGWL